MPDYSYRWTEDNMPCYLHHGKSVTYNGAFYICDNSIFYKYIPGGYWEHLADSGYVINNKQGVVYKEHILFFGGSDGTSGSSPTATDILSFNPETRSWNVLEPHFAIKRHYNFGILARNNDLFVVGGREASIWNELNGVETIQNIIIE